MTPAVHYIYGIAKAAAPPLIPWVIKIVAHMRITYPEDNAIVRVGPVRVCGRYNFQCGLSFVLLYHSGSQYWPQGTPVFDRTRRTWEKEVRVKRVGADRHFISIASLDDDARPLFDHYYRLGETKREWDPITRYALPNGLTILHSIRVQPEVA
jgi:hypothetical protein